MGGRRRALAALLSGLATLLGAGEVAAAAGPRIEVGAWIPYWDQIDASASLLEHRDLVESSSPFWFEGRPDGGVAAHPGAGDPLVLDRLRRAGRVIPTVGGAIGPREAIAMLGDPDRRRAHLRAVLAAAGGHDGVDFNYEHPALTTSPPQARQVRRALSGFLTEACSALRQRGQLCVVTVMPRAEPGRFSWRRTLTPWVYDYRRIGAVADRVRVMGYDQHGPGTGPGPIAGIGWLRRVLDFSARRIDPGKLELGIPLYGRSWHRDLGSEALTWREAVALRAATGSRRRWSRPAAAPWFRTAGGEVHYSNRRSVAARARLARRRGLRGVYLWAPGAEDPGVWGGLGRAG